MEHLYKLLNNTEKIPVETGGPVRDNFQYYKISLPSHAGISPNPALHYPTSMSFTVPDGAKSAHVTWVPETNVNMKFIGVFVNYNVIFTTLAWWSGPFDFYIGFN